jgi:hypothetical protein
LEEIELQAIDEITDEELPDIDFKDWASSFCKVNLLIDR